MSIQVQQMQRPVPGGLAVRRAVASVAAGRVLWQDTAHGPDTGVKTGEASTP